MAAEAGIFPGADVLEVSGFLLGAVSRSAQQPGENLCSEKGQFKKVSYDF